MSKLKVRSLFAGISRIDLAFQQAEFESAQSPLVFSKIVFIL